MKFISYLIFIASTKHKNLKKQKSLILKSSLKDLNLSYQLILRLFLLSKTFCLIKICLKIRQKL